MRSHRNTPPGFRKAAVAAGHHAVSAHSALEPYSYSGYFAYYDIIDLPAYKVPSVKDYFMDLDEILNIISDGPAKSYAYRRLRYLESKWNMYSLLREYQEIADSKVN